MSKKRTMYRHLRFDEAIYGSTIHVHIGDSARFERFAHKKDPRVNVGGANGKCVGFVGDDVLTSHIFISDKVVNGSEVWKRSTIAHEAFHATAHLFRTIGLPLSNDSEEAFCYYLAWVVGCITRTLK